MRITFPSWILNPETGQLCCELQQLEVLTLRRTCMFGRMLQISDGLKNGNGLGAAADARYGWVDGWVRVNKPDIVSVIQF